MAIIQIGLLLVAILATSALADEPEKPQGDVSYRIASNPLVFFLAPSENRVPLERLPLERVPVERVPAEGAAKSLYRIRYTLGNRVNGDRLVYQFSDNLSWVQPQNSQLQIKYSGSQVSFVDIIVTQSSTLRQAYVIAGGIGQRYITLIVEASYTTRFQYVANIYGR